MADKGGNIPVCSECKSADVMADAYASWNREHGCWELDNTFDKGAYCNHCAGETSLKWVHPDRARKESGDE